MKHLCNKMKTMFGVSVSKFVRVYSIKSDSVSEHLMQSVWLTCWHRKTKESNGNLDVAADIFISWWISKANKFDWHFENRHFCQASDNRQK